MSQRPIILLVVTLILVMCPAWVGAQDGEPLAALLEVRYADVELRRAETDEWLPVSPGAIMPIGAGDVLRTGEIGRALVTVGGAQVLVLPSTEWRIDVLTDGLVIRSFLVRGEIVVQAAANTFTALNVNMGYTVAALSEFPVERHQPLHWLVKSQQGQSQARAFLLVDDGQGGLVGDTAFAAIFAKDAITAGSGPGNVDLLSSRENPFNPAQIEGDLFGCPGTVRTEDGRDLNARAAPSTDSPRFGTIPDRARVPVMGINESGGWYRVQYKSGFGWVQRLAVMLPDADCTIPALPDDSFDVPTRIINPDEREVALLKPFYGTPSDDPFFYQFTDSDF